MKKQKIFSALLIFTFIYFVYIWLWAIEPVIMHSQRTSKPAKTISFKHWKILQYEINNSQSVGVKIHTYLTYPGIKIGEIITKIFF